MLDEKPEKPRNEDEHSSAAHRPSDKSGNRSSAAKAASRLFGPDDPESTSPAVVRSRNPRIELSLTQILGSTAAAVTAAFLGSRLGVAGTLIGAALASVISVVGGAIYTTSIKATRQKVAQALSMANRAGGSAVTQPLPIVVPTTRPAAEPVAASRPARQRMRRPVLRGALVGGLLSAVVFTGAIAVVTGVETVSGSALSGGTAGSLTILGGRSDTTDAPAVTTTTAPATSRSTVTAPATVTRTVTTAAPIATSKAPTPSSTSTSPSPGTTADGVPLTTSVPAGPTDSAPTATTSVPTTAAPTTESGTTTSGPAVAPSSAPATSGTAAP